MQPSIYGISVGDPNGDNDGRVERGEAARIVFSVNGGDTSISSIDVTLNGAGIARFENVGSTTQKSVDTGSLSEGDQAVKITAVLNNGKVLTTSIDFHVTRNYDGWVRVDSAGSNTTAYYAGGVADIKGTQADGNWIRLTGGRDIEAPYLTLTVDGGMLANRTLQCFGMLGRQNGEAPIIYSFAEYRYPIYYSDSRLNNVNGKIDLSKDYDNMDVGVGLISLSKTPKDPVLYRDQIFRKVGDVRTDENGDATLPAIGDLTPDLYLLIVYDDSVPDGKGLLAVAPFYVVDYIPSVALSYADKNMASKTSLNPGDNLMVKASLPMAPDKKYLYAAFALPASDYKGTIGVSSTGTISDMDLAVDAFTTRFTVNYAETLKSAGSNLSWAQNFVKNNFKNSNMSAAVGTGTGVGLEMPLKIGDKAMAGKYVLVTAVIDPDTSRVVSLGQTSFTVTPAQPGITISLTLLLVVLLFILLLVFLVIFMLLIPKK